MDKANNHTESTSAEQPSDVSRWLSAMAYAFVLAIFVLYEARKRPRDDYLRHHAKQGFVLFFVEFTLLIVSMVLHSAHGDIKLVGLVLLATWDLREPLRHPELEESWPTSARQSAGRLAAVTPVRSSNAGVIPPS